MNIATVVEGPTDRLVLQAILDNLLPGEHRYFALQPTETLGQRGTGWKGVRRWCRETWQRQGSSLATILSGDVGPRLDMLVIQVDADIATEHDLQEGDDVPVQNVQQDCPPVEATTDQLRRLVGLWLRHDELPSQVILAIPAQDTESWTFAALFPDDGLCGQDDYECTKIGRDHPGHRLTLKKYGKLLHRRDGEIKKPVVRYRGVIPRIAANWGAVCRICSQARQFTQDVLHNHFSS
jgi:hypothetical protein